jgi:hypothetical protein
MEHVSRQLLEIKSSINAGRAEASHALNIFDDFRPSSPAARGAGL